MKLAIAGCGRIASVHYEAIEKLIAEYNYEITLSALIDISEINARNFQKNINYLQKSSLLTMML